MEAERSTPVRRLLILLVFVVGALAGYFYAATRPGDPDMFWHLATGRWILEHGAVPTTDVFSWWGIANHRPWVAQEWLFGLGAFAAFTAGGYTALYAVIGAFEGLLAVLFYVLGRLRGLSTPWALGMALLGMAGTLHYVVPRPQIVTYCLMLLMMVLLEKKRFWWALPVIALGVNLHGGVWIVFVGIYAFYALPENWKMLIPAVAVCALNPNPIGVFGFPFLIQFDESTKLITEYTPTAIWTRTFDRWVYLAMFLLVASRRVKVPLKDAAFALAFFLLGLSGIRHVVWLYVFVIPVLAPYLVAGATRLAGEAAPRIADWRAGRRRDESADEAPAREAAPDPETAAAHAAAREARLEAIVAVVLLVAAVGLGVSDATLRFDPEANYPGAMTEYLISHRIGHAFTPYNDGGFMIWKGYAPLVDGRQDPFVAHFPGDAALLNDYSAAVSFDIDPVAFFQKYGITYVLVNRAPLDISLQHNPAFTPVASTNTHVLWKFDASKAWEGKSAVPTSGPAANPATGTVTAP